MYDMTYMIFMVPAFILMMIVQGYVKSAYNKWSKVQARSDLTGAEAAKKLMSRGGLLDVSLESIEGTLSDHYDPRKKTLRLSNDVYHGTSVASLAIAAHELGHAMQDKEGYTYMRVRSALVPVVNIGSYLGWILIIAGIFLKMTNLSWLGVFVFSGGALFALATLPVEFNASARAKQLLAQTGIVQGENEIQGVNKVLNAAALTYVAALITALLQLLYFASMVFRVGRRR